MRLPFPTKPSRAAVGFPDQARPCSCGNPLADGDGACLKCGRLENRTICTTWAKRADVIDRAARARPRREYAAPERRLSLQGRRAAHDLAGF